MTGNADSEWIAATYGVRYYTGGIRNGFVQSLIDEGLHIHW